MQKNKKIISFEQLFEDEAQIKKPQYGPLHYLTIILIYFGIMLLLGTLVIKLFQSQEGFIESYNETEMLLYNVEKDVDSLAFVNKTDYLEYEKLYTFKTVWQYEGYYVIVNEDNIMANTFFIDENILLKVFNEEITNWDNDHKINFYIAANYSIPDFFNVSDYTVVKDYIGLSSFGNALSNFIIYIFLIIPLLFLTKKDFEFDFITIKERKNEWLAIVLVGYLYLIIGNIASNFLTNLLSDLFKQPIVEAQNQQIIVNALNSRGAGLMIISAIFLGPIVEEIVFRKAIFGIFKKDYIALIVSTFIFGLIHVVAETSFVSVLINGLTYFIMGLAFGLIYMKNDKNIYVSIAVHILSNLVAVLGVLFII